MNVHVNLVGNWTQLVGDDMAENYPFQQFFKEQDWQDYEFIRIEHEGKGYKVHRSQIQILVP